MTITVIPFLTWAATAPPIEVEIDNEDEEDNEVACSDCVDVSAEVDVGN